MAVILIAISVLLLVFLNFLATVDIKETGILQGVQKTKWLFIVWAIPFVGFLIFQIAKPSLYGAMWDEKEKYRHEDSAGEAMDALLNLPDTD